MNRLVQKTQNDFTIVLPNIVIEEAECVIAWKFPTFLGAFKRFLSELSFEYFYVSGDEIDEYPIRDENDKKILHAAYASSSDALITGDKDFFEQNYEGLEILTPQDFLKKQ
ncbi:MAG: PIN domain nuclease [Christensenellaceae bacterium]|jgi:predicted nucleic acid-binding protein|nr:PIN domain nuclease [Christensenellaceae bacterium]